jgi:hypothetical protein
MHTIDDGTAYLAWAISYMQKKFMKSTTGVSLTKLFAFLMDTTAK